MAAAAAHLQKLGVCRDCRRDRLVVEKPFGRDLPSAMELDRLLTDMFAESQIYRIDHYLGKETVQNNLAFRFANSLFEPVWNRRYIDHVQITVAEDVGVEGRGGYYDGAGALRDMVQNHLMAEEYEALLRRFFAGAPPRFDLVFLGLGVDGHTASLFPGSLALDERERWTAVVRRAGEEIDRVTLTLPLLNQAELVLFLVAGEDKAAALREVLEEAPDALPAGMVRPEQGELRWLVDRPAARLLRGQSDPSP